MAVVEVDKKIITQSDVDFPTDARAVLEDNILNEIEITNKEGLVIFSQPVDLATLYRIRDFASAVINQMVTVVLP